MFVSVADFTGFRTGGMGWEGGTEKLVKGGKVGSTAFPYFVRLVGSGTHLIRDSGLAHASPRQVSWPSSAPNWFDSAIIVWASFGTPRISAASLFTLAAKPWLALTWTSCLIWGGLLSIMRIKRFCRIETDFLFLWQHHRKGCRKAIHWTIHNLFLVSRILMMA